MATAKRFGAYEVESELGRGAFGVVYRAHSVSRPDVPVALKVVENRGNLDRMLLEPALLSKLNHPCIVHLEDYFLAGDRLVLALEFIDGEDLKTYLERGEVLSQEQVRHLLVQMASALAHAHANNIIHRDIKLSNILVTHGDNGLRFVLTDFGIGQKSEGIQLEKHTGGTYYFMAPEQLRGRPGPQSDLWALGVVGYRLLAGQLPFTGDSVHELSSHIFYSTPPPPSRCTTQPIDAHLETIVFHLLEKSLNARTATAEELLQELGHTTKPTPVVPTANTTTPTSQQMLDRQAARGIRRYQWFLGGFLLLIFLQKGLISGALLLGALVLLFLAHQRPRWQFGWRILAVLGSFVLMASSTLVQLSGFDLTINKVLLLVLLAVDPLYKDLPSVFPSLAILVRVALLLAGIGFVILFLLLPLMAAYCYAELRRRQRLRALRQAILESTDDPDRYLDAMKAFLSDRFEDVGFHLKYIEALLARGRLKDVAVEARVLLRQDPYNFNGNLHLANAYFALELLDECRTVCDDYLKVSGYCFEFNELKEQCLRKEAAR